jgi:protein-ribulosamine 3-kinase
MKSQVLDVLSKIYGTKTSIENSTHCSGGSINEAQILQLSNQEKVFIKNHPSPPLGFFNKEAQGLEILRSAAAGPKIPRVLGLGPEKNPKFILLEFLEETQTNYFPSLGKKLAALHKVSNEFFGLDHDNFIGKTPQINTQESNGIIFFRDHRIGFQQDLARKNGLLPIDLDHKIDRIKKKLDDWLCLENEKPALLHGDLWSGNYFGGPNGEPCLFDPAVYFGFREADLAMMELFGSPPKSFFDSYVEVFPLNPGYGERRDLFNLYHLLNHLNLFGSSYLSSVKKTADFYST